MRFDRVDIIPFIELRCDAPACQARCCVLGRSWKDCQSRATVLGWVLNLKRRRCLCPLCATSTVRAASLATNYDATTTPARDEHTAAKSRVS